MRLKIVEIANRGVPGGECLHLAVQAAVDLNFYAVFDTARIGGGLISRFSAHTYWFQPQAVMPGDTVTLYTGPGANSFAKLPGGAMELPLGPHPHFDRVDFQFAVLGAAFLVFPQ